MWYIKVNKIWAQHLHTDSSLSGPFLLLRLAVRYFRVFSYASLAPPLLIYLGGQKLSLIQTSRTVLKTAYCYSEVALGAALGTVRTEARNFNHSSASQNLQYIYSNISYVHIIAKDFCPRLVKYNQKDLSNAEVQKIIFVPQKIAEVFWKINSTWPFFNFFDHF